MKYILILPFLLFNIEIITSQEIEVLTLGTFHFAFHNLDIQKTLKENQIDVLDPKHQEEIEKIVENISSFKPTLIVIESDPKNQSKIDSLYNEYLNDNYELNREESEQIGFRLAKRMGLKKLHCVNDWGSLTDNVKKVYNSNDSIAKQKFFNYFYKSPDTSKLYSKKEVFKTKGIIEELRELNSENHLKKDLGNYLISIFKYQTEDDEFFGVDFTTGWWFNRNLRIFRNIQRIKTTSSDRIVVIFGSGHMNLLNIFFEASPEYKLVRAKKYLD